MSIAEDLTAPGPQGSDRRDTSPSEAWRPRLELGPDGGFVVSTPRTAGDIPDAADLLGEFDLDPSSWNVTSVRRSRWQRHDGEWLEAYRLSLTPADREAQRRDDDLAQLVDQVAKWRPSKSPRQTSGDLAYIAAIGDTQYGKDAGTGTDGTIARTLNAFDESADRLRELRRAGRQIGTVCLPQLGDCIEGSASQNGKVLGRSDLSVTQQVRLGRRMLLAQIKLFAGQADRVIVPVVPGNHDEPHRILITDPLDSWQVDVVSAVQDVCAENPALAGVEFRYPEPDDPTLAVELAGAIAGFAHGHQSRDAVKWWQGQAAGRTPVGSADLLITAHFHHLKVQQVGPRLWIQVPAMDGGSPWFRAKTGLESPPGLLTLTFGDGWDARRDLAVLGGAA